MKITYDKEIDAIYFSLKKGKVAKTLSLSNDVFTDLDKSGNILGIEILSFSKHTYSDKNSFFSFGGKTLKLPSLSSK